MILTCTKCSIEITINPTTPSAKYLIEHYGQIDKVTGRIIIIDCPFCDGELITLNEIEDRIINNIIDTCLKPFYKD